MTVHGVVGSDPGRFNEVQLLREEHHYLGSRVCRLRRCRWDLCIGPQAKRELEQEAVVDVGHPGVHEF